MNALREIGYDDWVTVELDAWPNPQEGAMVNRRAIDRWLESSAVAGR
jgi:sugar phosphate isomerase/epimerase